VVKIATFAKPQNVMGKFNRRSAKAKGLTTRSDKNKK
jgi:hypothetical protein